MTRRGLTGPYMYPPDGGMDVYGHPTNLSGRCEFLNRNEGNGEDPPSQPDQEAFLTDMAQTHPDLFLVVMSQWELPDTGIIASNVTSVMEMIYPPT